MVCLINHTWKWWQWLLKKLLRTWFTVAFGIRQLGKNYCMTMNPPMNRMYNYAVAVIKGGIVIRHLLQTFCTLVPCFFEEVEHNMQCHRNNIALLQKGLKILIIYCKYIYLCNYVVLSGTSNKIFWTLELW